MKKRILCVILSIAAICSMFGFSATQAWFNAGENKYQVFTAGNLTYVVAGELGVSDGEVILPGTDVAPGGLTVTNKSSIDSNLRIQILCTYTDENKNTITKKYTGNEATDFMSVEFASDSTAKWVAGDDGYIYFYSDFANKNQRIEAKEDAEIPFISHLVFSGPNVDSSFSGKTVTVKVIFESKQADFIEWANIGSISS